ncbi:hypothetical protein M9Y10_000016 [Tritrichomonas musculus]|uniref:Atg6 BARA domain-containing protein n=1 Tax=Tritrichomonas musculus TaxID=1915356 RepID=A0ABR2L358_9EUKA
MKKINDNDSPSKSIVKIGSPSSLKKHNTHKVIERQTISNALCICSKCKKICLITPDFWAPPVQNSPIKSLSNNFKNFQIYLNKNVKWEYDKSFSAFKQNSLSNSHFIFPCCPLCFKILIDQIRLNNDFYLVQQDFLNSAEENSTSIKKAYLSKVETEIDLFKQQTTSMKEIIADKKHLFKKSQKVHSKKESQNTQTKNNDNNHEVFIPCILNHSKLSDSSDKNEDSEENSSSSDDENLHLGTKKSLTYKNEYVQSQNSITFSFRSLGFCGISLCLAFHITTHNHYGCINGMRIGTMTPNKVPTMEFDQGLLFFAQLIKSIASIAKIDIPNLVISNGIYLYEEIKYENHEQSHSKAATTDVLANRINIGQLGKMKIKMKLFEIPKIKEKSKDTDKEQNAGKEEMISLSTMTKNDKRKLSGSADSLKPKFYSSESVQLTSNDLKTSRGIQIFRKAMSILMSIVYRVLYSSAVSSQFNLAYELQNGGSIIHGISLDYDKQNPSQFTYAMKLLLYDLKSIQLKALEEDVDRINDEL